MKVIISSGHGMKVRGASGYVDEVDEARLVVEEVARVLRPSGHSAITYHDDVSTSQSENLDRIVDYHNSQSRDVDISVHFNAYDGNAHGCEVLYATQEELADRICDAICEVSGFTNRGPKLRSDLAFLNGTAKPSVLIEVCFCDHKGDTDIYENKFYEICAAIAAGITGEAVTQPPVGGHPERPQLPGTRPELEEGDTGKHVAYLQKSLGINADGEFGPLTETQVEAFQAACGLPADGVVGQSTWDQVDALVRRVIEGEKLLTIDLVEQIETLAMASPLNDYSWPDRGQSPPGYLTGMALSYAVALQWWDKRAPVAELMARGATNPDTDALKWYQSEFSDLDIDVGDAGVGNLRALFTLLIGLGMRESSGEYCCGRDQSATNVESDTCEAGLFQTSWNIRNGHSEIPPLLEHFWEHPNGFLPTFRVDIFPTVSDLECYGSGDGATYQFLSKYCPLFHVMVTAAGARVLRQHWGPINRREVTLHEMARDLCLDVEAIVTGVTPPERPDWLPPEEQNKLVTVALTVPDGVDIKIMINGEQVFE